MLDLPGFLSNIPSCSTHTPGSPSWARLSALLTFQTLRDYASHSICRRRSHPHYAAAMSSHGDMEVYAKTMRGISFATSGYFQAQNIKSFMWTVPSASIASHQVPRSVQAWCFSPAVLSLQITQLLPPFFVPPSPTKWHWVDQSSKQIPRGSPTDRFRKK